MSTKKTSIFVPAGSLTSLKSDIKGVEKSSLSFRDWHMIMQNEHERLGRAEGYSSFRLWKWCYIACRPCRWFDNIDYNKKICKCCLKFKTFKTLGTILLIAAFIYILAFSIERDKVLPGGSIFFLFLLFLASYLVGFVVMLVNLPPVLGNVVIGIIFGNVPRNWLPGRDDDYVECTAELFEKLFLVIAVIRAGLLLDLSRIKNRILFITRLAFFPFFAEFNVVCIVSHYLLNLPWEYAALQGSTLGLVSLASLTSILEKNKQKGYGEDKHLSTVLIASSSLNVIFSLVFFTVCMKYIFLQEHPNYWTFLLQIILEFVVGLGVGLVGGFLIAFFPDKRNSKAAVLRILMIGISTFAIASILAVYGNLAAAVISCLTMCLIATNMWEELGWHQHSNPVQYFYTLMYYICQPMVLSLLGFTMNFRDNEAKDIGLSIAVIFIGLAVNSLGRELICFASIQSKTYPTTLKEKLFICIAWVSKGTIQVILAFAMQYLAARMKDVPLEVIKKYSGTIKRTSVLAILLTTPVVCLILIFSAPKLLSKRSHSTIVMPHTDDEETATFKRRPSVKFQEPDNLPSKNSDAARNSSN